MKLLLEWYTLYTINISSFLYKYFKDDLDSIYVFQEDKVLLGKYDGYLL